MVRDNYPRIARKAAAEGRGAELGRGRADRWRPRVYELTEFLVDVLGVTDVGAYFPHTVTYHPSCHGLRLLGLGDRPRRLLDAVKGLELRELPGRRGMLRLRRHLRRQEPGRLRGDGHRQGAHTPHATGAEVLCGADNSCLMHIGGILHRQDAPMRALHIAEILLSTEAEPHV